MHARASAPSVTCEGRGANVDPGGRVAWGRERDGGARDGGPRSCTLGGSRGARRSMRSLVWLLALALCACSPGAADAPARQAERPSFVVFLTDDQPFDALGCAGNARIQTPNLDALAARGVRFSKAFVTTPVCAVSRASLLTGQNMGRHGIEDFDRPLTANQWAETFPALLRDAGYRTAFLGKFAIGAPDKSDPELCLPAERFDFWYGFPQGIEYKQVVAGETVHLTTTLEQKAEEFLRSLPEGAPFCLIVAFKEPHGPFNFFDPEVPDVYGDLDPPLPATMTPEALAAQPPLVRESFLATDNVRRWMEDPTEYKALVRQMYRAISRADLAVGRIGGLLEELDLAQRTVVLMSSDNGNLAGAHGLVGKFLMYEESIRVPLIVADPRGPASARGSLSEAMALNIDLAPTILALAGVRVPERMQGQDLAPLLADPSAPGRADWYGEHVFTPPRDGPVIPPSECVRTERWKYIHYLDTDPPLEQLFDLRADPPEQSDLAADPAHAATLSELRARCAELRAAAR
jgi:arylsulfatase A-like enzyme